MLCNLFDEGYVKGNAFNVNLFLCKVFDMNFVDLFVCIII